MSWIDYFIALGLPIFLILLTFLLAVTFHQSDLMARLFLWCLVFGLAFDVLWVFVGVVMAVSKAFGV